MSEERIPPDGIIARHYADREESMTAGMRRYLRDCLLRAIRSESMPQPMTSYKVKPVQAVAVRQRAAELVPEIEAVRAGDARLPRDPVQEALEF